MQIARSCREHRNIAVEFLWKTVPGLNLNRYHRGADSADISALTGNGNDVVGPVV
jgi:hypothetical protein